MAEESTTKFVNDLVRTSFGKRFRGDFTITNRIDYADADRIKTGSLNLIAKENWYSSRFLRFCEEPLGRFTTEDGSSLEVNAKYEEEAKKYVRHYRKKTGRNANFVIMSPN